MVFETPKGHNSYFALTFLSRNERYAIHQAAIKANVPYIKRKVHLHTIASATPSYCFRTTAFKAWWEKFKLDNSDKMLTENWKPRVILVDENLAKTIKEDEEELSKK